MHQNQYSQDTKQNGASSLTLKLEGFWEAFFGEMKFGLSNQIFFQMKI